MARDITNNEACKQTGGYPVQLVKIQPDNDVK